MYRTTDLSCHHIARSAGRKGWDRRRSASPEDLQVPQLDLRTTLLEGSPAGRKPVFAIAPLPSFRSAAPTGALGNENEVPSRASVSELGNTAVEDIEFVESTSAAGEWPQIGDEKQLLTMKPFSDLSDAQPEASGERVARGAVVVSTSG